MKINWNEIDKEIVAIYVKSDSYCYGFSNVILRGSFVNFIHTKYISDPIFDKWFWRPGHLESQIKREPNWDEAPEWAAWWALDENGSYGWYENKPEPKADYWAASGKCRLVHTRIWDWASSLQKRPVPIQKSDAEVIAELRAKLVKKEEEIQRLTQLSSD